jgi:quercetin dioxygenase-like cupin family protein
MSPQAVRFIRWNDIPQEQVNEMLSRRIVSGEREMVAQITLKKGCVVPEHAHESEQITCVIRGALKFTVGGQEVTVRDNEVLHIPSHVPHAAVALEETFELDVFSPIRHDWLNKTDDYLRR